MRCAPCVEPGSPNRSKPPCRPTAPLALPAAWGDLVFCAAAVPAGSPKRRKPDCGCALPADRVPACVPIPFLAAPAAAFPCREKNCVLALERGILATARSENLRLATPGLMGMRPVTKPAR